MIRLHGEIVLIVQMGVLVDIGHFGSGVVVHILAHVLFSLAFPRLSPPSRGKGVRRVSNKAVQSLFRCQSFRRFVANLIQEVKISGRVKEEIFESRKNRRVVKIDESYLDNQIQLIENM